MIRRQMGKRVFLSFLFFFLTIFFLTLPSCRKKEQPSSKSPALIVPKETFASSKLASYIPPPSWSVSLIDTDKIQKELNLKFKILKTDVIGYMPLHKFYWVCLAEKAPPDKIELLARRIIEETIAKQPKTFHSFTLHFFWEAELKDRVETSPTFARASFLPFGDWQKIGRVPIEDYKDYKLILTFVEK